MARVGEEVDVLRARPRHPRPRLAGVRETLPPVPGGGALEHGHTGSTIIQFQNQSFISQTLLSFEKKNLCGTESTTHHPF